METTKHRTFQFLDADILPDNMLVSIAVPYAFGLGVLSSRVHTLWALSTGGRLGVGNNPRYNKSRCFEPFLFPAANAREAIELHLEGLAEYDADIPVAGTVAQRQAYPEFACWIWAVVDIDVIRNMGKTEKINGTPARKSPPLLDWHPLP